MEYKEKYENGLECIQEILSGAGDLISPTTLRKRLEPFFPELKDGDERIKKEIIDFLRLPHPQFVGKRDHEKWIAWIEKQSKQDMIPLDKAIKFLDEQLVNDKDEVTGEPFINFQNYGAFKEGFISFFKEKMLEKQGEPGLKENESEKIKQEIVAYINELADLKNEKIPTKWLDWLKEQGENKPTDKVEPKFKPGDWIIFNGLVLHIDEVVNGYYRTTSRGDGIHNSYDWDIDNAARLWTIQDAKDGDVLTNGKIIVIFKQIIEPKYKQHIEAYIGLDLGCDIQVTSESWSLGIDKAMPATKEQRDLLFQKMKEAGYKWDADKKELKKIEPKTIDADKVINWVNPNKVIEWLKNTIKETEEYLGEYGEYYDIHLTLPYDSIEDLIDDFKKNFKL